MYGEYLSSCKVRASLQLTTKSHQHCPILQGDSGANNMAMGQLYSLVASIASNAYVTSPHMQQIIWKSIIIELLGKN